MRGKLISVARYLCGLLVAIVLAAVISTVIEVGRPPTDEGSIGDGIGMLMLFVPSVALLLPFSIIWTEMTIVRRRGFVGEPGKDLGIGLVVMVMAYLSRGYSPLSNWLVVRLAGWLASVVLLLFLLIPEPAMVARWRKRRPMLDGSTA